MSLGFFGYKKQTFSNLVSGSGEKFNSGVYSIAVQSDGKILVGGGFSNYAGTTGRSYLIRLNSDGTLDTAFCTNAVDGAKISGIIFSVAVQSDGKILVGGTFTNYAGTAGRNRLIRLNADGTVDAAFCVNATDGSKISSTVNSIAVQSDGKILACGTFPGYAGTTGRSRLIRLNSDGTLDTAFCTNAVDGTKFSSGVNFISVQSDGKILVGGAFTNYAGTAGRNRLIRLNSDGTLDTAFCVNATDGSKISNTVYSISVQSDGKILVGGDFYKYAGTTGRNYLIRLNSDGTLDTAFCVNATDGSKISGMIYSVSVQSDGKILVSGNFINYAGTTNRNRLIRLNSDGTLDTAFCTNAVDGAKFNSTVNSIAVQSDGKILVGGGFTILSNATLINPTAYFARFTFDGYAI